MASGRYQHQAILCFYCLILIKKYKYRSDLDWPTTGTNICTRLIVQHISLVLTMLKYNILIVRYLQIFYLKYVKLC